MEIENEDEYEESVHSELDSDEEEIDYNSYNSENDELDDELNSDSNSEDDEVLPENNHIKFNIVSNYELYEQCEKKKKKLNPFLTNFEKVKIISLRAEQIENNSPVLVDVPNNITNSRDIAELEYKQKKIPFIIRRYIGYEYEDWKLSEFLNY